MMTYSTCVFTSARFTEVWLDGRCGSNTWRQELLCSDAACMCAIEGYESVDYDSIIELMFTQNNVGLHGPPEIPCRAPLSQPVRVAHFVMPVGYAY